MDQPRPILVMLSGGINSLVASMRVLDERQLHFLHIDHGQAASENEREASTQIARSLAGTLHVVELCPPAKTEMRVGQGIVARVVEDKWLTSADEYRVPGVMLAMFGVAQSLAHRIGADKIVCGASQLCNDLEPDARHIFHHAAQVALEMGSPEGATLSLDYPFMDATRVDIIRVGNRLGAPFHLSWSCLLGGEIPCRECPRCRSLAEAFEGLGLPDPHVSGAASRVVRGHAIG